MNQEQVWNKIAEQWNRYRYGQIPEAAEFLKNKKGKILDLGCGSGRNLVKNDRIEYYGVDFSAEMLKFAEENTKKKKINAVFFKSFIEELPFEDNFFDAAVFISTLHCTEGEKNRKKTLKELYRVMKKGAEAIISVWDKEKSKRFEKIPAKEGFVTWKKEDGNFQRYYYFYDREELEALLKKTGFKILEKTYSKEKHSAKNIVFYVKK